MDKSIVISFKTIIYTVLMAVGVYLLYKLGAIIGVIFVSMLLTISLEQTVGFFMKKKIFKKSINRSFAVLITYLLVLAVVGASLTIGFDPVITQTQKLVQTLLQHQDIIAFGGNIDFSPSQLLSSFAVTSDGVLNATKSLFSNVAAVFSMLILSVYFSIDWTNLKAKFISLFPEKRRDRVRKTIIELEQNVGYWLRGQIILMLSIGVISYIALLAIGVEFPLALAILSGLFEIVPIVGPVISAVVAGLVAIVDSPVKAALVVGAFVLIQNLEGSVLVPKVMQKVSGFSPLVILIALLIGSNLFGIVGAVVAVPFLMIGTIIVKNTILEGDTKSV